MKPFRYLLPLLFLSLPGATFAQSHEHPSNVTEAEAPKSPAQVSFETMKALAGEWEGPVKTDMPEA